MRTDQLVVGVSYPVTLVDGIEGTPHVTAVLSLTESSTIRVTVPYVHGAEEHAVVQSWFDTESVPPHLIAFGKGLSVELFGCSNSGYSAHLEGTNAAEGHIDAEEALFSTREAEFSDPLEFSELNSQVDGLFEWSQLTSVQESREADGEGWNRKNTIRYTVKSADGHEWRQNEATVSISTTFQGKSSRGICIEEDVILRTRFEAARSFRDHLIEQRKVVSLLSILYGTTISFRRHSARDETLQMRTLGGNSVGLKTAEVLSRQTLGEFSRPLPQEREFHHPIARMTSLLPDNLTSWSDRYAECERVILPIEGIFRVPASATFIENVAFNSAVSLEALGTFIGFKSGEYETYSEGRQTQEWAEKMNSQFVSRSTSKSCMTVATNIYRAISNLELDWDAFTVSEVGLARSIADNYNTIKHPDKGAMPLSLHTRILSDVSCGVARLNALKLAGIDLEADGVNTSHLFRRALEILAAEELTINHEGQFVSATEV